MLFSVINGTELSTLTNGGYCHSSHYLLGSDFPFNFLVSVLS